jgi:hypothetical protein
MEGKQDEFDRGNQSLKDRSESLIVKGRGTMAVE